MTGLRKGARIKIRCALVLVLAAFVVGCGSTEPSPGSTGRPDDAAIHATSRQDRQLALHLQDYLVRLCPPAGAKLSDYDLRKYRKSPYFHVYVQLAEGEIALCGSVSTIEVNDSRVTLRSGLEDDAEGRAAGEAFCNLVRGSDVADRTPGHELQDSQGRTIKVCPVED
jgi:hypothetical protein